MLRTLSRLPPLPLDRTLTASVLALAPLFSLLKPVSTIDLAIFMRMGAWMAEEGRLLEVEPFALGAGGAAFQNGTWLAQYLLYLVHAAGGYPGLQGLLAALVAATLAASSAHLVHRGTWRLAGPGLLFVLAFLLQNLAIRPQSFSLPLFAAVYLLVDQWPDRRFTPPLLFVAMALWANLHGAFPVAFAFPTAYLLEDLRRRRSGEPGHAARPGRWVLLGLAMIAGTLVNPYGPAIYRYILENSALPVRRGLSEWLPPEASSFLGGRFYFSLALSAALAGWARRRVRLSDAALLLAFALLGARSQRMIVWWGLTAAPILVRWVSERRPPLPAAAPSRLHTALGYGVLAFFAALLVKAAPIGQQGAVDARGDHPALDADTPVEAATFLRARPPGRLFHRLEWGGYLAWRLPESRTFIDIRVWIFSQELWDAYLASSRGGAGWQELMERFGISTLVLSRETQSGLIQAASSTPGWHRVHADRLAVVFDRREESAERTTAPARSLPGP